jgi:hypothetical protein
MIVMPSNSSPASAAEGDGNILLGITCILDRGSGSNTSQCYGLNANVFFKPVDTEKA